MRSTQFRRWVLLLLALASAFTAGQLLPGLNQQRVELGLMGHTDIGDAPPGLVLTTTALGGLRAIIVDVLWLRVMSLQEEGRFFELVQLFDWIGKLQPRFTKVWSFGAWNLAYNVSGNFPADHPEQRWRWVRRGIEVLRDDGIPNNRNAAELHHELAWLYYHKIGGDSDRAHRYYKVQLAVEMEDVLGTPPYEDRLLAMAEALDNKEALLRNPAGSGIVKALDAARVNPFNDFLVFSGGGRRLPAAVHTILREQAEPGTMEQLDLFFRASYLRDKLKLDPRRMHRLMKQYGPIDWRLPDALTLYWAAGAVELQGSDLRKAAREDMLVLSALLNLYERGMLYFERGREDRSPVYLLSPHFGFLERVADVHKEIADRYESSDRADPARSAYLDFLRDTVVTLYLQNNRTLAAKYMRMLREEDHAKDLTLEEFVGQRFRSMMKGLTPENATMLIVGFLFESLFRSSAGQLDQAAALDRRAALLHKTFNASRPDYLQLGPLRQFRTVAMMRALRTFQPFQIERLRALYPRAVEQAEQKLLDSTQQGDPAKQP